MLLDMDHALVKLSRTIDWSFLEERFAAWRRKRRRFWRKTDIGPV
jgi:hypothetical protein